MAKYLVKNFFDFELESMFLMYKIEQFDTWHRKLTCLEGYFMFKNGQYFRTGLAKKILEFAGMTDRFMFVF